MRLSDDDKHTRGSSVAQTICQCGCGEVTSGAMFKRGHNARCRSKETLKKLSEKAKGHKNRLGKTLTLEQRKKIAIANTGHVHSDEQKKKISKSLIGNKRALGNRFVRPPEFGRRMSEIMKGNSRYKHSHGIRHYYQSPLQGQVCFRSSYELAYAKYLDSIGEVWLYEEFQFDLGSSTYLPDFYLPKEDKFVEIKGYMHPDAQKKIDLFVEEYPVELDILFFDDLNVMGVFN